MRDEWESKKADLESKLSGVLGETWKFNFDAQTLYNYAVETNQFNDMSKSNPGLMLFKCVLFKCLKLGLYTDKICEKVRNRHRSKR